MPDTNFTSLAVASNLTVGGRGTFAGITNTGSTLTAIQVLAAAGASQGNAGVITGSKVIVTVTASTEGVKLPVAATGLEIRVHVPGTIGVKVYPATGARINAVATNTADALVAGKANIYMARDTTRWVTLKGA